MSQIDEVVMCISGNKHSYRRGLNQSIFSLRVSGIDVEFPKPSPGKEKPEDIAVLAEYICDKCGHYKYT